MCNIAMTEVNDGVTISMRCAMIVKRNLFVRILFALHRTERIGGVQLFIFRLLHFGNPLLIFL